MTNPPIGPGGIPNPFGFDLEQLMRMLQSQGPVNFEIAQQVAAAVATAHPETGEPEAEPPIDAAVRASFDDVVRAAQGQVAEATGIGATLGIPSECVDRSRWANTTLDGLAPVLNALAGALQRGEGSDAGIGASTDPAAFDPASGDI